MIIALRTGRNLSRETTVRIQKITQSQKSHDIQYSNIPPASKHSIKILPPVCTRLAKCTYCPILRKMSEFKSTHTGKTHKCVNLPEKHRITCEIYNVVYLITCDRCQTQYTGESGRPIRKRIYEHIASVKNIEKIITPVSNNHSHKDMKCSVIQWLGNQNDSEMTIKRRSAENNFIWNIPTVAPIGINQFI